MPATVIVGAQWGDEGKGKIVDLLARDSDLVCRYNGGPNAGHTLVVDGETYKLKHIPSGILQGKECVIGAGCVVNPEVLIEELDDLGSRGVATDLVRLSGNAHLIMPWHLAIDQASERRLGKLAIGTTKRGIGPCYADKAMRLGIRVQDILDPKILRQKIEVALAEKNLWLERVYESEPFDLETVASQYERYAQRLRPYVADTSLYVDTPNGFARSSSTPRSLWTAHSEKESGSSSTAPMGRCSTSITARIPSSPPPRRWRAARRSGRGSGRLGSTA